MRLRIALPVRQQNVLCNKWYPVMNTTKDALKNAPGYKYDNTAMTWFRRIRLQPSAAL